MRWIAVCLKPLFPAKLDSQAKLTTELARDNALRAIRQSIAQFTPTVCQRADVFGPCTGWLLEVQSCLRLFGGLPMLLEKLESALASLPLKGVSLHVGHECTATGAWWKAKHAPTGVLFSSESLALHALPIDVLDCPPATLNTIAQCGVTHIGSLRNLPRDGLLRRFGHSVLAQMDDAYGTPHPDAPSKLVHQTPTQFQAQRELAMPSRDSNEIIQAIEPMLHECVQWLDQLRAGTRELQLNFILNLDKSRSTLRVRSSQLNKDLTLWRSLIRHRLEHYTPEDDVRLVEVVCTRTETLPNKNLELLPSAPSLQQNWQQTRDVLCARLGSQAVLFAHLQADPRPECSVLYEPHKPQTKPRNPVPEHWRKHSSVQAAQLGLSASTPRPILLLPQPQALARSATPASGTKPGKFRLISGPERIEFGWWSERPCRRDYYCALDPNHSMVWIFEDLNSPAAQPRWYLHGYFA